MVPRPLCHRSGQNVGIVVDGWRSGWWVMRSFLRWCLTCESRKTHASLMPCWRGSDYYQTMTSELAWLRCSFHGNWNSQLLLVFNTSAYPHLTTVSSFLNLTTTHSNSHTLTTSHLIPIHFPSFQAKSINPTNSSPCLPLTPAARALVTVSLISPPSPWYLISFTHHFGFCRGQGDGHPRLPEI